MFKAKISWDGSSEALKKFLVDYRIDPKTDSRYQHFFVKRRHTAATSYTWRGTNLYQMADRAELAENANDLVFIDVLVVNQFSISSSAQVINTTDLIYCNCKVWVFLDDDYLGRAWCLAECGQYTRPESKCVLVVYGKAEFKPGLDFLLEMKAGVIADLPMIQSYILDKFKSKEVFNQAIDKAIVMLSPLSLLYQGRYADDKIACEQEIQMLKDSRSESSTALTKATVTLATALFRLGQLVAAREHLTSALEICAESELELRGDIMNRLGTVHLEQGNHGEALIWLGKSLDCKVRCFGTEHVSSAETQNNIAIVLRKQGKLNEALEMYETALKTKIVALGHNHVTVAETEENMAIVYEQMGKLEKALETYQKVLETKCRTYGHCHVSVAQTHGNMGCVYQSLGDYEKARFHHDKALEIKLKCLGPDHVIM